MFLIEIEKGVFIDGEDIQWVKVEREKVGFILKSDCDTHMIVGEDYQASFVNNLQAINGNIASVENIYHKANK